MKPCDKQVTIRPSKDDLEKNHCYGLRDCKISVFSVSFELCAVHPGWLLNIGNYTTQLYGGYNAPI